MKETKEEVCTLQRQCNSPVTLYEAFQACHEIFPDVAIVLEITGVILKWNKRGERIFVNEPYYE